MVELKSIYVIIVHKGLPIKKSSLIYFAQAERRCWKKLLTEKKSSNLQGMWQGSFQKWQNNLMKLNGFNREGCDYSILSIGHTLKQGKVAFSLVKHCTIAKYQKWEFQASMGPFSDKIFTKNSIFVIEIEDLFCK